MAALAGGWAAWQKAGYRVERGETEAAGALMPTGSTGTLGDPQAPIVIEEFSDFQCGYCAHHALNTLPLIKEAYIDAGLVYYVVRDLPLEFHPNARAAASAARCAGAQDAYWAMHDLLYEGQSGWSGLSSDEASALFVEFADKLELDSAMFRTCLFTGEFQDEIDQDVLAAKQAGVTGTPSFLLDGELMVGAYPFETFEEKIEAALKKGN